MGYIYKITNKIDNKIYIGQTINDLEQRWKSHWKKKSNCRYLSLAFKKHGVDNFKFELICISFDENLDELEKYYIKKLNSLAPNGYNLREGGNSSRHSEETKLKISQSLKGRTDIVRSKSQLGKKHSEETKKKISESGKARKNNIEWHINKCKTVLQIDENDNIINKYISAREAARQIGISSTAIILCCQGKRNKAKGFKWVYE